MKRYYWEVTFDRVLTYGVVASRFDAAVAAATKIVEVNFEGNRITEVRQVGEVRAIVPEDTKE